MARYWKAILGTCSVACLTSLVCPVRARAEAGVETSKKGTKDKVEGQPAPLNSEITLDVSSGPHAGHYVAKVTEAGCSNMSGTWGNQYSIDTEDAKRFSSLQLIVPNAKEAANGAKAFKITVMFGPMSGGTTYDIDTGVTGRKQGTGTLRIEDRGSSGTVTFDATTREGVRLKGTIECHSVLRIG